MGKIFSLMFGVAFALWMGWIVLAADESTRVERAGSVCGGAIKVVGSVIRAADESTGETIYAMHKSWSAACQDSIWYFFVGGEERRPTPPIVTAPLPSEIDSGKSDAQKKGTGTGRPVGDEQL